MVKPRLFNKKRNGFTIIEWNSHPQLKSYFVDL